PYPLYSAIHAGCIGVEADIWLYNQELYVGHTTSTLQPNRTLNSMYVKPLVEILDARNPPDQRTNATSPNGIFMEAPQQTLVLLIDFKMDGDETWPYLMEQLNPLREKGYLTYFNGTTRVEGPVTVVGSGNAPYHLIVANSTYRDVFYDAPLAYLHQQPVSNNDEQRSQHHADSRSNSTRRSHTPTSAPSSLPAYDYTNSYYASASFKKFVGTCWGWLVSKAQLDTIRSHVHSAHERGLP
ncbi:Histidine biosynthesis bifunctional protein hisB, partial [Ascosphaera pollenicola]